MTTGELIRSSRKAAFLTVKELSGLAGVSRSTLVRYENGTIRSIPGEVLGRISRVLGVPYDQLLGDESAPLQPLSPQPSDSEKRQRLLGKIMQKSMRLNNNGLVALSQQVEDLLSDSRYLVGKGKSLM